MFRPVPKRKVSALVEEWERRLTEAGEHPPEIRSLTASSVRDGLRVVPLTSKLSGNDNARMDDWAEAANLETFGEPMRMADTATAVYWREFSLTLRRLPPGYAARDRAFLVALADSGCVDRARATIPRLAKTTAVRILKRFAVWREANPDKDDETC